MYLCFRFVEVLKSARNKLRSAGGGLSQRKKVGDTTKDLEGQSNDPRGRNHIQTFVRTDEGDEILILDASHSHQNIFNTTTHHNMSSPRYDHHSKAKLFVIFTMVGVLEKAKS